VVAEGDRIAAEHLAAIAARVVAAGDRPGILVVNPDLAPRPLRIVHPGPLPGGQAIEGGHVLSGDGTVPGLTASVIIDELATGAVTAGDRTLENALLRVEVGADGTLASVFDKRAGREALAGRGNQVWAHVDKPRNWDAWDIEDTYATQGEGFLQTAPSLKAFNCKISE
jgi:alpha-mannosidase